MPGVELLLHLHSVPTVLCAIGLAVELQGALFLSEVDASSGRRIHRCLSRKVRCAAAQGGVTTMGLEAPGH